LSESGDKQDRNVEKATGWANLAKRLGFTRQNLLLWRKREGAPESYEDVHAWEEFLAQHRDEAGEERDLTTRKKEAETKRVELQAEKIRLEVEQKRGNLIPIDRIVEATTAIISRTKAGFLALESELPAALSGKDEGTCARIIREKVDGICSRMQSEFETLAK
jgi:hypothetical protein